jgi:hypothetical protein
MAKNSTLIVSAVLIGAGAYLIYNKSKKRKEDTQKAAEDLKKTQEESAQQKIKEEQQATERRKKEVERMRTEKQKSESLENPNSYVSKVAKIQSYLGVTPDGKVGKNTYAALTKKFPQYTFINSGNVDLILADIESNKKSASDLSSQKTSQTTQDKNILLGARLIKLLNEGKYNAQLIKDINPYLYIYDKLTNDYKFMNVQKKFSKGTIFRQTIFGGKLNNGPRGTIHIIEGENQYQTDPNNFIILPK